MDSRTVAFPLVSVVMPVFNSAEYLSEAIESILNQTYGNFEYLIVYDKSADNSLEIIEEFMRKDNRIFLFNGEKKGLSGALNLGIEKARGKYIARMDADDISLPDRFRKQVDLMETGNLDICGCHFFHINAKGKYIDTTICPLTNESFLLYLLTAVPFAHGSAMMRASFLKDHGLKYGGGAKYAEDFGLWMEFFQQKAKFSNVDDFLFKVRNWPSSISNSKWVQIKAEVAKLRKAFIFRNGGYCMGSVNALLEDYGNLGAKEKVLIVKVSFFLSLYRHNPIFFKCIIKSDYRPMVIGILKIFAGRE